jgi:hypothetical protein
MPAREGRVERRREVREREKRRGGVERRERRRQREECTPALMRACACRSLRCCVVVTCGCTCVCDAVQGSGELCAMRACAGACVQVFRANL